MNSLQIVFVPMFFVSISPLFDVALGEEAREKLGSMGYEWEAIQEQVQKYSVQNEYATSQGGWLETYKREQKKKQTRGNNCLFTLLEEIKEKILQNPHAKLFTEADKSGHVVVYDFKSHENYEGGCFNLRPGHWERIKSVDTEGTCVRLFSGYACTGWSQAIYPGSPIIPDAKLEGVESIGPCVPNEFEHSAIIKSTPPQLEKLPLALESFANIPDLIGDADTRSETFISVDTDSNPVWKYLLGPGNRVEALVGWISPRHLKSPEIAENARIAGLEQSFYSKLELGKRDEPGFAIPLELGGPAHEFYNVFPQNRKQAVIFRGKIIRWVKRWLTDHPQGGVSWQVNFVFKNSNTTRPSGIWYSGSQSNTNIIKEPFYSYVPNGP